MTTSNELAAEAVKASPPLTVAGLTIYGVGLQDWILILTAIYTVIQIFILIRDKLLTQEVKDGSK
jgi:hypothetical protein